MDTLMSTPYHVNMLDVKVGRDDRNLVSIKSNAESRRFRHLALTAEGRKLEEQLTGTQMKHLGKVFAAAGPKSEESWKSIMRSLAGGVLRSTAFGRTALIALALHAATAAAHLSAFDADVAAAAAAAPAPAPDSNAAGLAACRALGLTTCPAPFDAVLPAAGDMLHWDQVTRVIGFRNTYRLSAGDAFHTLGHAALALPPAEHKMPALHYTLDGKARTLTDYLGRESVTGLLILKEGRVVYEYYGSGNTAQTLWTSRSVAKSVVSILVGMAIKEGLIGSVDDPVIRYLPELKGSAWDGVTLRNLLQHTSGVAWNEHYADPKSDFAQLTHCEASPAPYDCVYHLISNLQRRPGVTPGEIWSYNTGGAWLVGRILEKASGMTIAHYLETSLWSRYAMQSDGVWEALIPGEVDMGGHGFNATLRDWGRFAWFVANGGKLADGTQLLPTDWIRQSTDWTKAKGSVTLATPEGQFGYQWWNVSADPTRPSTDDARETSRQTMWAEGIYGQVLAIDPTEKLVMVQWSTWKSAETPDSLYDEQALFFNAVSHALHH
jgi:CubicO group peptidase (beta-lactamase class C family)